jgi:hypothetical protein
LIWLPILRAYGISVFIYPEKREYFFISTSFMPKLRGGWMVFSI